MKQSILILTLCCIQSVFAQPMKEWSKIFGGNGADIAYAMEVYNDTMVLSVGKSQSANLGNKGADDFMICHFNPKGNLIAIKTFGGPAIDQANAFAILPNGNVILAGNSSGKGGDVTNVYGFSDGWMIGYDPIARTKLWDKNFGGSNTDQINDLFYLEAGKVFVFGNTKSSDRDLTANKGGADVWITTIDEQGASVRSKTFGGTKDEFGRRIIRAEQSGGQILLFGETESNDGDFIGLNKGKKDVFIIKLNRNSNQTYITSMGGPGDDIFGDALFYPDGSFIMFNTVDSTGGDVTDTLKGGKDIWMVKVNSTGKKVWSKIIGGTKDDVAVKASIYNGSDILLMCTSGSNDKDIKGNYGNNDVVIIKMDTTGNIAWTKNYGGSRGEVAGTMTLDKDGNIYFVAQSFSLNNDLPPTNTVPSDFWTTKVFECFAVVKEFASDACVGDTIIINANKYYVGKEMGRDTLKGMSAKGCDSIVNIIATFHSPAIENYRDTLCYDAQVSIENVLFDKDNPTGQVLISGGTSFGCDSTLLVDLLFAPKLEVMDTLILKDNGTGIGFIRIVMKGGTPPYQYSWSNGGRTNQINNLPSGTYTLTVTDELDCVQEFTFRVGNSVANKDIDANEVLKYWKNNEDIFIEFQGLLPNRASFLDIQGRTISIVRTITNSLLVKASNLPRGLLIMQLTYDDGHINYMKLFNQ